MDTLTPAQRSLCMSRIRSKDTGIEKTVRCALHRRGYRFRKNLSSLPGKPDIVFTKAKVAIFLDGDFWHGFRFTSWSDKLSEYWYQKINGNRTRDRKNTAMLRKSGWRVVRLWQHEVKRDLEKSIEKIVSVLDMQGAQSRTESR